MTPAVANGSHKWTLERWVTVVTFVATLVTLAFTGGVSWSRVTAVEQTQAEHETHVNQQFHAVAIRESDFVRKDVMALELARIYDQLKTMNERLASIQRGQQ